MKKSLVALAALAAGSTFAQSTVTIYGQADAAYTSVKSGANKLTGLVGAGRGSNFVGFMGSEDLGGGLKANFKLEAGYNLDNGTGAASNTNNQITGAPQTVSNSTASPSTAVTRVNATSTAATTSDRFSMAGGQGLTFNRWSYVGLSGGFGEVRVGREYTPTFQAVLGADTTGANGVQNTLFQTLYLGQANSHATATSASNGVSYESPSFNGLKVKIQQFYGEVMTPVSTANSGTVAAKSGDGNSYHVSYAAGKLSAGFGAQKTKGTNVAAGDGYAQVPGQYEVSTAYAKYDLGMALVTAGTVKEEMTLNNGTTSGLYVNKTNLIGVSVPVSGALKINGTYAKSKYTVIGTLTSEASQLGLQALYSLSKRTDLYANYAVTDNSRGSSYGIGNGSGRLVTVSGNKSTAYQAGIRHNF
jgi:predicted porin